VRGDLDGVDQFQADSRAFVHGHGHGAVGLDHRRRGSLRQQIVQRDDLAPIGGAGAGGGGVGGGRKHLWPPGIYLLAATFTA